VLCDDEHARDVTLRQRSGSYTGSSQQTPVRELMTTHVFCVRPDVSIDELVALLIDRDINGVPVVDAHGAPIGFISKTDLVRQRYEDGDTTPLDGVCEPGFHASSLAQVTVADLMALVPITFSEQAPIAQVADAMVSERVHQLPIVGMDGTVVGIVSSLDLVRWYLGREGHRSRDHR
jgi:CBS domain-containing protein